MSRECYLTGKKNLVVNSVTRRGKARAQGGVGRKVTGVTKRVQRANLHKRTIREGGVTKTVWLSANALRTLSRGPYRGIELL
ncbi:MULTISPECIES: 50S ribosomal protein L28 [Deinococcus]|uniref:Large subunit ribosomal protein L28 n=2 Tax=Deinococcus soli (ex Cha et al. 2016) TaxID=1309411 RepID=A0ACC6KC16_9DEIO|nr:MULTISPECIES: 50S ribosomal protein L28 [Deinococcus]MDK2010927.1 50S ribosomal protein L28 [Deinococcus sp. 43]MDR6216901.1 large subunit ribosomal protein L28 [Deinococcus soli (ex Cha et al. 2016)]MDR6327722.1 large subunit ribosomal protein L28 [Deinococcus soli (ex Cha et al. 2016)]MDR6749997.1 large subunit ribosomal protein L28 [Deinococcus soli (ex Cha et al. 2016)]GGB50727.1 50S ribosomal protein L28 [Deinococcus soli (ex Cha et al. 2016)]